MGLVHTRIVRRARFEEPCLPNPLVGLCVQGEAITDGGDEVDELADSIEFVVGSVMPLCPVPEHSSSSLGMLRQLLEADQYDPSNDVAE